jgi:Protein of unknown function (DUF2783)
MSGRWTQEEREAAYTQLCEAITAAGEQQETLFLARLCLLLAEECGDAQAFGRALAAARLTAMPSPPADEPGA